MNTQEFKKQDELTRRQIMANAARSYLGVTVAPMLGGTLATGALGAPKKGVGPGKVAEHVIFLNMQGGMSHLDTFDPKPRNKEVQGPVETQFGHHLLIVEKRSDPSAEAKAKKN